MCVCVFVCVRVCVRERACVRASVRMYVCVCVGGGGVSARKFVRMCGH